MKNDRYYDTKQGRNFWDGLYNTVGLDAWGDIFSGNGTASDWARAMSSGSPLTWIYNGIRNGYDASTAGSARDYVGSLGFDNDYLNKLTDDELEGLLSEFTTEYNSNGLNKVNEDALKKSLAELQEMKGFLDNKPLEADYYRNVYSDAEREASNLLNQQTSNLNNQLASINSSFDNQRNTMLSQANQQNSQLMDTMQSQMTRQRRNALEAGASAGNRIAGNINTLLSTQNKMNQQALETNNNLAQMMVNQRAAQNDIYSQYGQAQTAYYNNRNSFANYNKGKAENQYNNDMDTYNNALGSYNNAFAQSYANKMNQGKYNKQASNIKNPASTGF